MNNLLKVIPVICMLCVAHISSAQTSSLYMTKNIKQAYEKGTRNYDGLPGENYFQNRTDYSISVSFDPVTRLISGKEEIIYNNNSPDTLRSIVIRNYPDLFKKGAVRKKAIVPSDVNEGVSIKHFEHNQTKIDISSENIRVHGTNIIIRLAETIAPNTTANFIINWEYTFQGSTNLREGRYHDSSYFIGYWYPKIAVYDDLDGWNVHVFDGEQEFYNEYGDFKVNITVPNDYLVWASGLLQNPEEVYSKKVLKKYNQSQISNDIINVVTEKDIEKGGLTAINDLNTWYFSAKNLTDFSFAVSNSYLWDAGNVVIGDSIILVNAVYYKGSEEFPEVAEITKKTLLQLAEIMGVDYPYPQMTAFNGEGGMEFPMMVNDGDMGSRNGALFVTAHEESHTYFPFYVGTNEQKYAWMDEGLVTFLPKAIEDSLSHDEGYNSFSQNIRTYSYYAGTEYDQPPMIPSDQLMGMTYMYVSYGRSAVAFYVLKDILGEQLFTQCLTEFINRWKGKHPTPYDFFYTFEDVSKQDLGWFWKPWFFEFGYPDLAVKNIIQENGNTQIEIENIGKFPVPVDLVITYSDGSTQSVTESANIWKERKESTIIEIANKENIIKVNINTRSVPDGNTANNSFAVE